MNSQKFVKKPNVKAGPQRKSVTLNESERKNLGGNGADSA